MLNKLKTFLSDALATQADLTKNLFDEKNHLVTARDRFLTALPFWIAGSLTALIAILYARAFLVIEATAVQAVQNLGYWILLFSPVCFVLSWWAVDRFAPNATGSGIPQLMTAAELAETKAGSMIIKSLLGGRIIIVKVISSLLGVLGGGAIGREGPTLQIAGSVFDMTSRFLPRQLKATSRQGMILAGGAAGLAAAFNTPLGGIAYVIEELSKSHLSFFRTGILHAVIVAGLISQLVMGSYLYFGYPKVPDFSMAQLGLVIVVALVAGLMGTFFGEFLKYIFNFRSTLKTRMEKGTMAAFSGFVIAIMILFLTPNVMGSGRGLLEQLLFEGHHATFADAVARFLGTAATYASGGAGGIFAPTLAIGGVAGNLAETLFFDTAGPLAVLVGMTASLAALTHSPLTSFILILEMTDRHSALLPIMVAAMIGHSVSKLIAGESFYEFVSHRLTEKYSEPKDLPNPQP